MKDGNAVKILVGVLTLIVIARAALWTAAIREGRRGP